MSLTTVWYWFVRTCWIEARDVMTHHTTVKLVICWHMHQPDYRDHIRDEFQQPWVYLHAIRDYTDMAAHLENNPEAKAVVNFSPILLEQLAVYEKQIAGFLNNSEAIRDPLLAALDAAVFPSEPDSRIALVRACLRSNRKTQIEPYAAYAKLAGIADSILSDSHSSTYLSNQYIADLVTWYHLAWLGETVRRSHSGVRELMEQGTGFSLHQRRTLLQLVGECITSIRDRYRKLAANGQIELSTSPYTHPMLPLLLSFDSAREAQTDVRLPILDRYPGGTERVRWQLQHGLSVFEDYFGFRPAGCWPSEGGICDASLQMIGEAGFKWVATGESVLTNSINRYPANDNDTRDIYGPYSHATSDLRIFARDDTLSDLIGFTYADWHADDAVANLVHAIESIVNDRPDRKDLVISIIMDGENAWEYYPENGYYFISTLYQSLAEHPYIQLTTYQETIADQKTRPISNIVPGSWVFGNFSTWIGDEDKNRAWDILGDAKRVYDDVCAQQELDASKRAMIDRQLAACEGSDWFWWFGDYNPARSVSDFEHLYRTHLANLYQMLTKEPPQYLAETFAHGHGSPVLGGVIRPGKSGESG
ncbi:MAG: glycoside hydrolase family 57 protein [Gammaproteobacteria bacterium]